MPSHLNVVKLIKTAATKPLAIAHRCRGEMVKLEAGYHQRLYDIVSAAYASAWHLGKSPEEWKRLLANPFWKKAKKPKGDKGGREELHRVMMYVCDAVSDHAYDRAYKYARALEPYLVEKVPPAKVRERIESDGGLEKLYDRAKKEIPLRTSGGSEPDEDECNDDDLTSEKRKQSNNDDGDGGQREHESKTASSGATKRARLRRLTLGIEISAERLERVLSMSKGQEGVLRFKALDAEKGWHRFRATKLKMSASSRETAPAPHAERVRKVQAQRVVARPSGPSAVAALQQHRSLIAL